MTSLSQIYDRTNIPATVGRGTLDKELEDWLSTGPTLGADVPIHQGRRDLEKCLFDGCFDR